VEPVENTVGESAQDCMPDVSVTNLVLFRIRLNSGERDIHFCDKLATQTISLAFVPLCPLVERPPWPGLS
jgi:hypothetical protein